MNKKAIIIGAGVAGPILALQLKKIGFNAEIFESRSEDNTKEGAFLGLTPNGLNVLKEFIDLRMLKDDYTPGAMRFFNSKGKQIAELGTAYQKKQYGVETLQLKRANLNKYAQIAAADAGIKIGYDKKFVRYDETNDQVTAYFADGTMATGDIMIGCDGMFSEVRNQLFPEVSAIKYTKLISTGGYAKIPELSAPLDTIRMAFGERGFFAYSVSDKGEVWWFNNYFRAQQPKPQEIEKTLKTEIQDHLINVHKNDDPLFSKIIRNSHEIIAYPIYDVPKLSHWYKGRVCLIGDAAHGISPHIGQGASLALEDTVVIAELLKLHEDYRTVFQIFQSKRQPRVEKVIKSARKLGDTKTKTNPIAAWFRDCLIGFFIGKQIQQLDWIYGWTYSDKNNS
ncbi:FAD-dependent urate hydroxylase [Pedobacter sp. Bi27]|uniref:FAD-dependent oxidoreductase n=1 Tax=unclassified Pedobacter TaxID=2628915 RepID=UPI001DC6C238|nr:MULTISPECIES: NAD(P)/FAD-dependent oxidoreductase [unclassified Pedobacter]CAH0147883.1 FAD-dependent urate hydroxylase [Pedobacter sp. Bi126]CAH0148314.1 FAD-dependent urate hydroxylase [Pedobacter sp. Bi27]CAH0210465.1 FAD-dependent urate hydroxylase [Pedobacter sp. Bi36]